MFTDIEVMEYYLEQYNDYTATHKVCMLYSIAIITEINYIGCTKCPLYCNHTNVVCLQRDRLGCML